MAMIFTSACSIDKSQNKSAIKRPNEPVLKHLHYLSSDLLQGRRIGTKGGKLAQEYIVKQLKQHQIKPLGDSYFAPFLIKGLFSATQGSNIVGVIEGTEFPDSFIVLSAHFDHIGARGSKIYNGADDNASGTSALLHYAKRIQQSPLRHSVIVLFTDGEELNLNGAKAFIKQNPLLLAKIVLNINIDMIAGSAATKQLRYLSRGLDKVLNTEKILTGQKF